jgi:hypothetical protein
MRAILAPPPAAQRLRPRSKQQAALLFGQVRGDQREQLGQHRVHVHAVNLPTPLDPWHRSIPGQLPDKVVKRGTLSGR